MQQKDYYKILEVEENAAQQQIKEAYRKLAFQYHPDRNRDNASATEKMKEINEAYSVLSSPEKRKQYDRYGSSGYERFRQSYTEEDIFRGSDINRVFDEFAKAFGFRNADEVFKDIYGSGSRGFEFRGPGFFARGFFIFGPYGNKSGGWQKQAESYQSTKPPISDSLLAGILGKAAEYAFKKLTGLEIPQKGRDVQDVIYVTPEQAVGGDRIIYNHSKNGQASEVVITIPPGVRDGQQLRLKGLGEPGRGGGMSGDLYLKVRIQGSLYKKAKGFLERLGF